MKFEVVVIPASKEPTEVNMSSTEVNIEATTLVHERVSKKREARRLRGPRL
jgi:hypothetical protein